MAERTGLEGAGNLDRVTSQSTRRRPSRRRWSSPRRMAWRRSGTSGYRLTRSGPAWGEPSRPGARHGTSGSSVVPCCSSLPTWIDSLERSPGAQARGAGAASSVGNAERRSDLQLLGKPLPVEADQRPFHFGVERERVVVLEPDHGQAHLVPTARLHEVGLTANRWK